MLLEDSLLLQDGQAVGQLFELGAVLSTAFGAPSVHGRAEIARAAHHLWSNGRTYVADARHVLQARDTALVLGKQATSVVRRDEAGTWHFAICSLREDMSRPKWRARSR